VAGGWQISQEGKEGKRFFFEKKKQKTFASCGRWHARCQSPQERSFFCFFFVHKKEVLTSVLLRGF
jgi:hypothetical protein